MLAVLHHEQQPFPHPKQALREPNGLLAIGGDLSVGRLIAAYQQGIFPWYSAQDPILWWSPDPRVGFTPSSLHVSRSMRREFRRTPFTLSLNQNFSAVMTACADEHAHSGVWILPEVQHAYLQLHHAGHAHSIEVWHQQQLVGGLYGVAVGGVFCAESMFHRAPNASKIALIQCCRHFFAAGGVMVDAQFDNPHLQRLGSQSCARQDYLTLLNQQAKQGPSAEFWQPRTLAII